MTRKIRPIRVDGDVAYVTLTQGYVAVIDAADVPLVDDRNWYVQRCAHNNFYAKSGNAPNAIYMHRAIIGTAEGMHTDHIDGDGTNNRRINLRVVSCAENTRNQRIAKNNSSGFKGVSFYKLKSKWNASIVVNRTKKHLGYFNTPEEAHAAYCEASAKYHGEFGRKE